jgi:hypothetical protein
MLTAEAVEFSLTDAAQEGVPFVRREIQDRARRVPAVADSNVPARQVRYLNAVPVGIAQ